MGQQVCMNGTIGHRGEHAPALCSSDFNDGHVEQGVDGRMWVVRTKKSGHNSWYRMSDDASSYDPDIFTDWLIPALKAGWSPNGAGLGVGLGAGYGAGVGLGVGTGTGIGAYWGNQGLGAGLGAGLGNLGLGALGGAGAGAVWPGHPGDVALMTQQQPGVGAGAVVKSEPVAGAAAGNGAVASGGPGFNAFLNNSPANSPAAAVPVGASSALDVSHGKPIRYLCVNFRSDLSELHLTGGSMYGGASNEAFDKAIVKAAGETGVDIVSVKPGYGIPNATPVVPVGQAHDMPDSSITVTARAGSDGVGCLIDFIWKISSGSLGGHVIAPKKLRKLHVINDTLHATMSRFPIPDQPLPHNNPNVHPNELGLQRAVATQTVPEAAAATQTSPEAAAATRTVLQQGARSSTASGDSTNNRGSTANEEWRRNYRPPQNIPPTFALS